MTKKSISVAVAAAILVIFGILIWVFLQDRVFQYHTVKGDGYAFKAERISEKALRDVLDKTSLIPTDEVDLAFMLAVTELEFPVGSEIKSCYSEDPREFYSRFAPEAHWDFDTFPDDMYCIKISVPIENADEFAEYMCQKGDAVRELAIDADRWFGGDENFINGMYIEYYFKNNLYSSAAYAIKTEREYIVYFLI